MSNEVTLAQAIESAIEAAAKLSVRYYGGSKPGELREIEPIQIKGNEVRAKDGGSGVLKTFKLDKMALASDSIRSDFHAPTKRTVYSTMADLAVEGAATLVALGWAVTSDGKAITLHRRFKTGAPMKGADASISYEEFISDAVFEGENVIEANTRPRDRPWVVVGKGKQTKTFADFKKAQLTFFEYADVLATKELTPKV